MKLDFDVNEIYDIVYKVASCCRLDLYANCDSCNSEYCKWNWSRYFERIPEEDLYLKWRNYEM